MTRLLWILILSAVSVSSLAQTPTLFQKRFEAGVVLMGDEPSKAAEIFGSLYQDTQSARVQLEYARALYLSGQLDAAEAVFIDILQKPLPITVRDKVEWYLDQIRMQTCISQTKLDG